MVWLPKRRLLVRNRDFGDSRPCAVNFGTLLEARYVPQLTAHGPPQSSDLQNKHILKPNYPLMALSTPEKEPNRHEYSTITRCRFFDALDSKKKEQGVGEIAHLRDIDIPTLTARRWIKERERLGNEALRRTRKTSSTLDRKPLVSAADLSRLTD